VQLSKELSAKVQIGFLKKRFVKETQIYYKVSEMVNLLENLTNPLQFQFFYVSFIHPG
jgi:hypothetical protein